MDIHYLTAGLVLIAVLALVVYLIRRNSKDRRKLQKDITRAELKPDKHNDDEA
ncbi:FeoB-associated Cys-rich membrane protein [Arcticibacter sp.]|jgi:sensor c-di-GMP phosphodiesterase-like protein|uniref:FeoB-associated Cys-rich membrane protein n=1 Tax=Arcticibacter sp. TaxID=1872630 RepID=UPI00388D674F